MKTAIDFVIFLAGILVITFALLAMSAPHSEIVKMEFKEVQPFGRPGV